MRALTPLFFNSACEKQVGKKKLDEILDTIRFSVTIIVVILDQKLKLLYEKTRAIRFNDSPFVLFLMFWLQVKLAKRQLKWAMAPEIFRLRDSSTE